MIVNYIIIIIFAVGLAVKIYNIYSLSNRTTDMHDSKLEHKHVEMDSSVKKLKKENNILWCIIFIVVILNCISKIMGFDF